MLKKYYIVLTLVLTILGTIIGTQMRSTFNINKNKLSITDEIKNLKDAIGKETEQEDKLNKLIAEAEKNRENYLKSLVSNKEENNVAQLIDSRNKLKLIVGLTNVKGPGLEVEVNDALDYKNGNPEEAMIHYIDIVKILNELKKAGAQAISINDERVIWSSEQICAGPTVRINKNRYPVPFAIKAIGNPNTLYNNFTKSTLFLQLARVKIRVRIKKVDNLIIQKFKYNTNGLISALEVVENENR